ncbi:hypothetical protein [Gallionella capsiferriformans]|uniref:Uncharacterized protein n=1 Tax=Gallionella capsiferriformans (strain ES-2) TaxID=395494 RepID=D9SC26_GALCS|nr:hypothetical protein [Gallionella capsiferriformans]ADL54491.1 hypothetical protein Galf_0447 [Gallionella capsiferriformans ES-2]
MNEEQAVLDFFAKPENLPLGLSVAEQMDEIRTRMNTSFWDQLCLRLENRLAATPWQALTTEDRNAAGVLVGLQCKLRIEQTQSLFPMMEQQFLGGIWRVFFGLMWQSTPTVEQLALPAVAALKQQLLDAGFKQNEAFMAWQWTPHYPLRRDFLQRFSLQPEVLLDETEAILAPLLISYSSAIAAANASLQNLPRSMTISLDQLRRKRD